MQGLAKENAACSSHSPTENNQLNRKNCTNFLQRTLDSTSLRTIRSLSVPDVATDTFLLLRTLRSPSRAVVAMVTFLIGELLGSSSSSMTLKEAGVTTRCLLAPLLVMDENG